MAKLLIQSHFVSFRLISHPLNPQPNLLPGGEGICRGVSTGPIWPCLALFTPSHEAENEATVASFGTPFTRRRWASRPWLWPCLASTGVARSAGTFNLVAFGCIPYRLHGGGGCTRTLSLAWIPAFAEMTGTGAAGCARTLILTFSQGEKEPARLRGDDACEQCSNRRGYDVSGSCHQLGFARQRSFVEYAQGRVPWSGKGRGTRMRKLWVLWVGSTAIGLGIGGGAAEFVSSSIAESSGVHNAFFSPRWQVAVGFSFGVPALLAQYLMLRYFFPESIRWLAPTTIGLAIGVVCGGFAGLAIVIWGSALVVGCQFIATDVCRAGVFSLLVPAAGGGVGAVVGGLMGILLSLDRSREWLQGWTWPMVRAWAASGAIFWGLAPLLAAQSSNREGLLDTVANPVSIALAGVAGLAAGLVGGTLSARQFVRVVGLSAKGREER